MSSGKTYLSLSHQTRYCFFRQFCKPIYAFITSSIYEVVYQILKYLKRAPSKGPFFKKNARRNIKAFIDADWASFIMTGCQHRGTARLFGVCKDPFFWGFSFLFIIIICYYYFFLCLNWPLGWSTTLNLEHESHIVQSMQNSFKKWSIQ